MKTEFEAKILEIDVDKIISILNRLGAKKVVENKQRRFVYDFTPKKENSCSTRFNLSSNQYRQTILTGYFIYF